MMDVVIIDVPPTYGMMLSKNLGTSIEGSIQIDLSFTTILVFGGETKCLYKELKKTSTISHPPYQFNLSPIN